MAFEEMDDFEQEEQVKKWIKNNWLNMAIGIGLGLAGVYGINWWKQHQLEKRYNEANQFDQFAQVISVDELDEAQKLAEKMAASEPEGFYAMEARLVLASKYLEKGQPEKAMAEYEKIIAVKPDKAMAELAKIRLARLQLDAGQVDSALATLQTVTGQPMVSEKEEVSGDVATFKNQVAKAHEHYQNAANAGEGYSGQGLLQVKLANSANQ